MFFLRVNLWIMSKKTKRKFINAEIFKIVLQLILTLTNIANIILLTIDSRKEYIYAYKICKFNKKSL